MNGHEEQSWCECGHELELVRPGKFQRAGCCEKVEAYKEKAQSLANHQEEYGYMPSLGDLMSFVKEVAGLDQYVSVHEVDDD